MKKIILVLSVTVVLVFQACSKNELSKPVNAAKSLQQNAAAVTLKSTAAGDYTVKLYVENGDTSTAEFKGYVFTFKANGALSASIDNKIYLGKWESGNNGKQLKLDIKGTAALDDVKKNWDVVEITNTQILLKDNQGKFGDKLVFVKN